MNIFYLHEYPDKCAQMHCNKHVVKMVLEYTQLLSTAHRLLDGKQSIVKINGRNMKRWTLENNVLNERLFLASHVNHPCAVWARETQDQYLWLHRLLTHLLKEYSFRYGKTHSVQNRCWDDLRKHPFALNSKRGWREPPQAMPDDFKVHGNSVLAYRKYYVGAKSKLAKWSVRPAPDWWSLNILTQKENTNAVL